MLKFSNLRRVKYRAQCVCVYRELANSSATQSSSPEKDNLTVYTGILGMLSTRF